MVTTAVVVLLLLLWLVSNLRPVTFLRHVLFPASHTCLLLRTFDLARRLSLTNDDQSRTVPRRA